MDLAFGGWQVTVTGNTGGIGKVELRLVNQNFYIALGTLTSNKFVKIDLTDKNAKALRGTIAASAPDKRE